MKALNIFEVIGEATSQPERFHSEFLGQALHVSAGGDRSLFDAVWRLTAPAGWDIPHSPTIETEKRIYGDTKGGQRIDIAIYDEERGRLLGIEVKTTRASAKDGQLEGYLDGFAAQYGYDKKDEGRIAIAYLTPFNRKRAGDAADSLQTVKIFEKFRKVHANAHHVSWLDIADISWEDENELWRQHQTYVREEISSYKKLEKVRAASNRNREFNSFFSLGAIENFWPALPDADEEADGSIKIDLASLENAPKLLVEAFAILIEDDEHVSRRANKKNKVSDELVGRFLGSDEYGIVHRALFDLTRQYSHVWWEGKKNYALRVAHKDIAAGVSLFRSKKGPRFLYVGQRR